MTLSRTTISRLAPTSRVGYIARAHSAAVAGILGDSTVDVKCVINWNGEITNGIYRVLLFPTL